MTKNPCRNCEHAFVLNNKSNPSYRKGCKGNQCEKLKKHKEYLLSKRQFVPGDKITDLNELLSQKWVIWYGYTKHIEMFKSMPLRSVINFLESGAFFKAVKKPQAE